MNGLILVGGQSSRMGQPKSLLEYHQMPQYQHLASLRSACCTRIYLSCRADQAHWFQQLPYLFDTPECGEIGPMNGLLTAFDRQPMEAWLVVGCDYPFLSSADIAQLVAARSRTALATVFKHPESQFPEPLLGIYEAAAAPLLRQWFEQGNTSLRRFLENHAVQMLNPQHLEALKSVDTPEDFKTVSAILAQQQLQK